MNSTPKDHSDQTNMRMLRPSRAKRIAGDIFAYQMPDGLYRFGRLIARGTHVFIRESNTVEHLVYFYRGESTSKQVIPTLERSNLLIPPLVTNQKPWTMGFFEFIDRRPLANSDILNTHCFRDIRGGFVDENEKELKREVQPCGERALYSYVGIDRELSKALGFSVQIHGVT
jgi:hypothetical protein